MDSRPVAQLPFPIACSYDLFLQYKEQGDTVAAWLQARDVFEVATRLLFAALFCDVGREGAPLNCVRWARETAGVLLGTEPSFGRWVELLAEVASLVQEHQRRENGGTFVLPELASIVIRTRGASRRPKATAAMAILRKAVTWRNEEIGHGALGRISKRIHTSVQARARELEQLLAYLEPLAATPLYAGRSFEPPIRLSGPSLPTTLTGVTGLRFWMCRDDQPDRLLCLDPIVRAVEVEVDGRPEFAVAVFDKRIRRRSDDTFLTDSYLDYRSGLRATVDHGWGPLDPGSLPPVARDAHGGPAMASLLDPGRNAYSASALARLASMRLGLEAGKRHVRRGAVLRIREAVDRRSRGYTMIVGAAGAGKSWLLSALQRPDAMGELADRTLLLPLGLGAGQSPVALAHVLDSQVRSQMDLVTAPLDLSSAESLRRGMLRLFDVLTEHGRSDTVILALDGLDEVRASGLGDPSVLDFIPHPSELPEGVHYVLSSRPGAELDPRVRDALARLRYECSAHGDLWLTLALEDDPQEQRALVQRVAEARLSGAQRRHAPHVVRASGDSPLRAAHLASLAALGATGDITDELISFSNLYGRYLSSLRSRLGSRTHDRIHGRVLSLLGAAGMPLPIDVVAEMIGLRVEDVYLASVDLGDLLTTVRAHDEPLPSLGIVHAELRGHLHNQEVPSEVAHQQLADWLLPLLEQHDQAPRNGEPSRIVRYALEWGPTHMVCGGRIAALDGFAARWADCDPAAAGSVLSGTSPANGLGPRDRLVPRDLRVRRLDELTSWLQQLERRSKPNAPAAFREWALRARLDVTYARIDTCHGESPGEALALGAAALEFLNGFDPAGLDGIVIDEARAILEFKRHEALRPLRRHADAHEALERSMAARRACLARAPHAWGHLIAIAACLNAQATLFGFEGRRAAVLGTALEALEVVARGSLTPDLQALALGQRGAILHSLAANAALTAAERIRLLRESVDAYRQSRALRPWDRSAEYSLASVLRYLSTRLLDEGQEDEGARALTEAVTLLHGLRAGEGTFEPAYVLLDAHTRRLRARILLNHGRFEEALAILASAHALLAELVLRAPSKLVAEEAAAVTRAVEEVQLKRVPSQMAARAGGTLPL